MSLLEAVVEATRTAEGDVALLAVAVPAAAPHHRSATAAPPQQRR